MSTVMHMHIIFSCINKHAGYAARVLFTNLLLVSYNVRVSSIYSNCHYRESLRKIYSIYFRNIYIRKYCLLNANVSHPNYA